MPFVFSSMYIVIFVALVIFLMSVRICNQYQRAVVFFLGRYSRTAGPGLYLMLPFLEWRTLVDVRTTTTAVEQQETITKDNVPVKINAVIWRRVVDPEEFADRGRQCRGRGHAGRRHRAARDDRPAHARRRAEGSGIGLRAIAEDARRRHRALGRQGRAGADEEHRNPRRPCSARWRRRPRRCARSARARSRPRPSSRPRDC